MVDLSLMAIDPEVLRLIPKSTALELSVLPLSLTNDTVVVAMPEMFKRQLVTDVQFLLGKKIKAVPVPQEILVDAIHRFYESTPNKSAQAFVPMPFSFRSTGREGLQPQFAPDASTITLANRLIGTAIKLGSTDIHLEPIGSMFRVRYRVDGVLHEAIQLPPERAKPLVARLKTMVNLSIADNQRPQEGRTRVRRDDRTIDIRISTLPTDSGEKVSVRILDKSRLQLHLEKLGFEDRDLQIFQQALHSPSGLILVSGPEGSGKITTLYAALTSINRPDINITTIEDPVEFDLPGMNQTRIRLDLGLTFASALRVILRQDPNVILIGELRDGETARMAIRAAQTGHLVLSTLHTRDAASTIDWLTDRGIEPFLVASSLKMVLAQRLVRRLCPNCKIPAKPTPEQLLELADPPVLEGQFFAGKGCPACHYFGYRGRTGAFEVLPISSELGELITGGAPVSKLRNRAQAAGMLTLRQAALRKAERGETSLDEVLRETPSQDQ
ncbi:MAG: GspE/PulE family protein [Bacteroidota bacterium]